MTPPRVKDQGHVPGGLILSMVNRAAGEAAVPHSGSPYASIFIDQVEFKEPIFAGSW